MTYAELIKETTKRFKDAQVQCGDFGAHSVDFLLQVTELSREKLLVSENEPVSASHLAAVEKAELRRLNGEPLQYIVGHAWFWNSKFSVGPGVLIPRKETEHIVEYLLTLPKSKSYRVAELGAGSGNIGISTLQERKDWEWIAFEINPDSIPYLNQNLRDHLPADARYKTVEGDFFKLAGEFGPFDLVVSNPPYVSINDADSLSREVRREPKEALYSGASGLEHIERLVIQSLEVLSPEGVLVSEIGSDQGVQVKALALRHGFSNVAVLKDMAGLDRILVAEKRVH